MKQFFVTALSLALVACSSTTMTSKEKTEAYEQFTVVEKLEQVDKIVSFKFDSWTSLGKQHLILYRRFNEPYLITLQRNCPDLDYTMQIGVNNSGSTLYAKFDYITVPEAIPGALPVRCHIKTIHKLSKEQKKALVAIGKETKNDKTTNDESVESEQAE